MSSVAYTVSLLRPRTHLLEVTIDLSGLAGASFDLVMPAWTPGSYKIRDYARNVQDFSAGRLKWRKEDKGRWRGMTGGPRGARGADSGHPVGMDAPGGPLHRGHR